MFVLACADVDRGSAGDTNVNACAGGFVIAGERAAGAAVGGLDTGSGDHVGAAGDADVNAAGGGGLAVAWALVCGFRVVDDVGHWKTGDLGSRNREDGGGAEGEEEAHEAGEVDSSGDHFCGNLIDCKEKCRECVRWNKSED